MTSNLSSWVQLAVGLLCSVSLNAQTKVQSLPSAPTTGWQQLESTYQNELKKIHLPLLSAYINELMRLASVTRDSETASAVNRELVAMQDIIASGGVVDILKTESNETASESASKPLAKANMDRILELRPSSAIEITPKPVGAPPTVVPVKSISWTIDSLPKGNFDVICQGALSSLDAPVSLTIKVADQRLEFPLDKRHVSANENSMRLIPVGTIKIIEDSAKIPLVLAIETTAAASSMMLVRQVLIARTKASTPVNP